MTLARTTCIRGDCCMPSATGEYVDAEEALAVIGRLRAALTEAWGIAESACSEEGNEIVAVCRAALEAKP